MRTSSAIRREYPKFYSYDNEYPVLGGKLNQVASILMFV
jgi:hypothetical protein